MADSFLFGYGNEKADGKNDFGVLPGISCKGGMQQIRFDAAFHITCSEQAFIKKIKTTIEPMERNIGQYCETLWKG